MSYSTLALDLERTLVTDAYSLHPRDGLYDFVSWALRTFDNVVWLTDIEEQRVNHCIRLLLDFGTLPPGAPNIKYLESKKAGISYKHGEIIAISADGPKSAAVPFIEVTPFEDPDQPDSELERVRRVLTFLRVKTAKST